MALIQSPTATGANSTSSSSYDTYLQGLLYDTLGAAKSEANAPYTAYTGQRVAGFTPDELQSFQQTRNLQGSQQGLYDQAGTALNQGMQGLQALGNMPSTFGTDQLNQYMNPYIQGVVNTTTDQAMRTNQQELNRLRGSAGLAGAFGGSRQAIAEQELFGNTQRNLNSTVADLYSSGYGQAVDQFNKDRQFGIDRLQPNLQYAQGLSGLGDANQAYKLKDTEALYNSGNIQRNLAQTGLDTAYQDFTNQRDYNKGQIGFLSNLVNGADMSKYQTGQTTTQANTYPQQSTLNSILGGLSTGLGFLSNTGIFNSNKKAEGGLVKGYAEGGRVVTNPGRPSYAEPVYSDDPRLLALLKNAHNWGEGEARNWVDALKNVGDLAKYPFQQVGTQGALGVPEEAQVGTPPFVPTSYGEQFGPAAPTDIQEMPSGEANPAFQGILQSLTQGGKEQPSPNAYNPLGAGKGQTDASTTMADLFPDTSTGMDKMFEMNPMLAMGLGLLGASGNPNDAGYQFASGVGNALETYEGMKNQRQETSNKRGADVAEAMSRGRTADYNEGMLQEQRRANQVNEAFRQRQLDQAYTLAISKAQAGIRINPQLITSYNNLIAKFMESGNTEAAQEAMIKRDELLGAYLGQGGDADSISSSNISTIDTDGLTSE